MLSIITINYNNAQGLQQTVESILHQSTKPLEYIIIDGGSVDGSTDIIQKHAAGINFWVSEKDNGIYDALNKGIRNATGDYLLFLNSGDAFASNDVVKLLQDKIDELPDVDIFYGDTIFVTNNPPKRWEHKHPAALDVWFLQDKNLNHQSSVFKASLFKEFGLYPNRYKLAADHWLYLQSLVAGKKFKHIAHNIAVYNMEGLSHTNYDQYKHEMRQMWQELVPDYVNNLVIKLNNYRFIYNFKMVKAAIGINKKLQGLFKRHIR